CFVFGCKIGNAEEHVRFVLPANLLGRVRIGFHPIANALHRHLTPVHHLLLDENAADRRVRPAIVRIVVDTKDGPILQPDPGRTLNLREQNVDLVVQVTDFEMPAVERAILDLAAIVIGHDLAAADAPADKNTLAGKGIAQFAPAGGDQIRRAAVKRRGEIAGGHSRTGNDGLVIAGQKAIGLAELAYADGAEMSFEEFPRALLVERNGLARFFANTLQGGGNGCEFPSEAPPSLNRAAASQKSSKGGRV